LIGRGVAGRRLSAAFLWLPPSSHKSCELMEARARAGWARGRVPIFRKIHLYAFLPKTTHGHTNGKPTWPVFSDLAEFEPSCRPAPTLEPRAYYACIYIHIYMRATRNVRLPWSAAQKAHRPAGRSRESRRGQGLGGLPCTYPVPTLYLPYTCPAPTLEPPWVARGRRQGPWPGIYGSRGVRRHSGTGWRPGETHVHVDGWPTHRRGTGSQVGQMLRCWKRKKKRSKKRTRCQARPKGRMNKSIVGPNPSRAIHPSLVTSHARPPYAYAYAPTLYLPYTSCLPCTYPVPTLHPALYLYLTVTVTVTVTLTRSPATTRPRGLPCTYPTALRNSLAYPTPMPTLYLPYTYPIPTLYLPYTYPIPTLYLPCTCPTLAARLPCTYPRVVGGL
jgi:hypothetical protein